MVTLRRGTVTEIRERHDGLVRLEVDGRPCIAYPGLTGPVALGDDVLVNVQALDLELGRLGLRKSQLELSMGMPSVSANFVEMRRVTSELADVERALADAEDAWLELEELAP